MPCDQCAEPLAALLVLGARVEGPLADVGIGGNASIGSSSAAGGRGQTGDSNPCGAVEHAQSSSAEASPASSGFLERIALLRRQGLDLALSGGELPGELVAALLGRLQLPRGGFRGQAPGLGLGNLQVVKFLLAMQVANPGPAAECQEQRDEHVPRAHACGPQLA